MAILVDFLLSIVLLPVTIGRWLVKAFKKNKILARIADAWVWLCIGVYHFFKYIFVCFCLPFHLIAKFY